MTQQPEEGAVGGDRDTTVAVEPTIEDRFAALSDQVEEPTADEDAPAPKIGEVEELSVEDVTDEEAETPPISPPVSWTAEEKEEFKNLPRTLQETLTRREAEREKFVQTKANEAKQARSIAEQEALQAVTQLNQNYAQQLQQFAQMLDVPEPDPRLIAEDPDLYAQQLQSHRYYAAQRQQAQQQAAAAQQQAQNIQAQLRQRELAETHAILAEQFPEYLDAEQGPNLRRALGAIALEVGYSADQLEHADAKDILAMRKASEWKAKADKFDTLMAKKMEKVREAKALPKVSKPGVPQGRGAVEAGRYQADREAMKAGDKDATTRVFSRFL